jgi:hypothetical protein
MAQGHIMMHWNFFFVAHFLLDPLAGKPESNDEEALEAYDAILYTFQVLKYGHLANGIILLLSMIFKRQEKRNLAETL